MDEARGRKPQVFTSPLGLDQYGYTFPFSYSEIYYLGYILRGAGCIFQALEHLKFSGRCECYSAEQVVLGRYFVVAVAVSGKVTKNATPSYAWWQKLERHVQLITESHKPHLVFERDFAELCSVRTIRQTLLPCGAAEFDSGEIVRQIGDTPGNFLTEYCNNREYWTMPFAPTSIG